MIGQTIAHYEIVEKLGQGGMGVVYKARDLHLDRFVALKILPPEKVAHEDRRLRFVQEARAASALNHSNIVTIHDIDCAGGVHFIAMECISGTTLEETIGRKGLDPGETLRFAIQIAGALATAHNAGIIHRDLKPSNIMVTSSGTVKVLDFGLAKLAEPGNGNDGETDTLRPDTREGLVVGTVWYMSPEQAQGRKVDARTDIFSFGSMLYEMLTGRHAFTGDSNISVLGAILHKEPEPVPAEVPPALRKVVERCLRKDPERRFQHMADLKVELEEIRDEGSQVASDIRPSLWQTSRRILPWAFAAVLGSLWLLSFLTTGRTHSADAGAPVRFSIEVPQRGLSQQVSLSPDGRQLVYSAVENGTRQLFLRPMERLSAQPILGTEGANGGVFSADGQWLYFQSGKSLRRIRPSGGEASTVANLLPPASVGLCPDGSVLYVDASSGGGLARISGAGGTPEVVSRLSRDRGEFMHSLPELLPGGKDVLFTIIRAGLALGKHNIGAMHLGSSGHKIAVEDGFGATYASSGHLLFRRSGILYAAPFDLKRLAVTGPLIAVAEDLERAYLGGRGFAVAANGTLAYIKSDPEASQSTIAWVDRQGAAQSLPAVKDEYGWPVLSPDGRRLALTKRNGPLADVWIWDFGRETFTRATFEGENHAAIWSPDGASLVFSSDREGPQANLWRVRADGTGKPERLTTSPNHQDPGSFSPDGKLLAFGEVDMSLGNFDIWILKLSEGGQVVPFLKTKFGEHSPLISPDGRWIAYTSDESGRSEIYVQPFPAGGEKHQVSIDGGEEALWRSDGKEIYYRRGPDVMAAALVAGEAFSPGKPRVLFSGDYALRQGFGFPNWDVNREGKRFLMLKPYQPAQQKPRQIHVVLNWPAELRSPAPAAKQP